MTTDQRDFVEESLRAHAPILRAIFIERCGSHWEDAFQDFVAIVLIQRDLCSRLRAIDSTDGHVERARLLRHAAKQFCIERYRRGEPDRRAAAERRPPACIQPLDTLAREWARDVLRETLSRARDSLIERGQVDHWTAYFERVIRPASLAAEPTPIEDLCARTHFAKASEVYDAVSYVKKRIRSLFDSVILEHASSRTEAADLERHFRTLIAP